MHVSIGPYRKWWGPYQLADLLRKVGVSQERCHKIGKWLADTWVLEVCNFIDKRKHRRIEVQIDDYDTWSLDHTLAYIILPALKKLKKDKPGIPFTDVEDAPQFPDDVEDGGYSEERWNFIIDEMIYAFEMIIHDDDWETEIWKRDNNSWTQQGLAERKAIDDRIANGTRLFGKYYRALWS